MYVLNGPMGKLPGEGFTIDLAADDADNSVIDAWSPNERVELINYRNNIIIIVHNHNYLRGLNIHQEHDLDGQSLQRWFIGS